jgi:flagellar biosynthetic protein FliQ
MTTQQVLDIGSSALIITAKIAGPFLLVVLAVGVVIGILQSVTQLQEQTLTFVPKLIGAAIVIAVSGSWMLQSMVNFGQELMSAIPQLLNG